jgi:tetratricopeptide (TPR) repeat protein
LHGALNEYRKADALPNVEVSTQLQQVIFLARIGASAAALDLARRLQKQDPLNAAAYGREGYVLAYSKRYADAIPPARRAAQLAPTISRTHTLLGLCLMQLGRTADAKAEYSKAFPEDIYRLTGESILSYRQGNRAAADQFLQQAQRVFGDSASYQYAEIYAQRGDLEPAFAALNRAWTVHDPGLTTLRVDPFLDPLRGDPRFAELERKLNFPTV